MRRLLWLFLISTAWAQFVPTIPAIAASGGGTPSIVQVRGCGNFASSISCPTSSNITNGNVLVAMMFVQSGLTGPSTPSGCVTWTQQKQSTISTDVMTWSTGPITSTGSCTVTVTATGGTGQISMLLWECSNCSTTVDGTPIFAKSGTGGTPINGPTVTTTANGDMVFAGLITQDGSSEALTLNSPFTSDFAGLDNNNAFYEVIGHDVQASSGAIHGVYTNTVGSSSMYMGTMALEP